MNRQSYTRLTVFFMFLLKNTGLLGQISNGGTPLSISAKITTPIPVVETTQPNWAKIEVLDVMQKMKNKASTFIVIYFISSVKRK